MKNISLILLLVVSNALWANNIPTDTSKMIIYKADNPKTHITVYSDMDCGYCRLLHKETPSMNASGIEVRYLPFMLQGLNSHSHQEFISIYCSDNRQQALTDSMYGLDIEQNRCDTPVEEIYKQAKALGVFGTPSVFTSNGQLISGNAAAIAAALNIEYIPATKAQIAAFQAIEYSVESHVETLYRLREASFLHILPSTRSKGIGTWEAGVVLSINGRATAITDEGKSLWLSHFDEVHQNNLFLPEGKLERLGVLPPKNEIIAIDKSQSTTNFLNKKKIKLYFVPNENSSIAQTVPKKSMLEFTHTYRKGKELWLVLITKEASFFAKADKLRPLPF